jgi:release factor glutamine methyltransferase
MLPKQLLDWAKGFLTSANYQNPDQDAKYLLAHLLQLTNPHHLHFYTDLIPQQLVETYRDLIQKLSNHAPLQHIIGHIPFHELPKLYVSPEVLIPRPETEELVSFTLQRIRNRPYSVGWDLCTGSGCIALALANALPTCSFIASDLSWEALALAKKNHALYPHLKVEWRQGDLWAPYNTQKADLIIGNPPYIAKAWSCGSGGTRRL